MLIKKGAIAIATAPEMVSEFNHSASAASMLSMIPLTQK